MSGQASRSATGWRRRALAGARLGDDALVLVAADDRPAVRLGRARVRASREGGAGLHRTSRCRRSTPTGSFRTTSSGSSRTLSTSATGSCTTSVAFRPARLILVVLDRPARAVPAWAGSSTRSAIGALIDEPVPVPLPRDLPGTAGRLGLHPRRRWSRCSACCVANPWLLVGGLVLATLGRSESVFPLAVLAPIGVLVSPRLERDAAPVAGSRGRARAARPARRLRARRAGRRQLLGTRPSRLLRPDDLRDDLRDLPGSPAARRCTARGSWSGSSAPRR